jgi:HlyD family secretion protein
LRLFVARRASEDNQIDQLTKRAGQIRNQIEGIVAQQAALTEQLALIEEELVSQQALLDRGLAQAARVLALRREKASLLGSQGDFTAQIAQAEGRITETDIQIITLDNERREDAITRLRDLQFNELELSERRAALLVELDRLDIRAPVSGIVYDLTIFAPRSVVRPADPLMYLVPQDRPLVIAAEVETIHIDQVFVGQEVNVRFSAFDQRRTPELIGRVTQVSADAFEDERRGASFYRAEIILVDGEIEKLPDDLTLIPGMPAESFLRTDDRTPLDYLIKPLADYFAKAFRES